MPERRVHPRLPLPLLVRVFHAESEGPSAALLRDIALEGMFVEGMNDVGLGDECQVEVVLYEPGDLVNIWLEARVLRVSDAGVALAVTGGFEDSLDQLRELIDDGFRHAVEAVA